EKWHDTVGNVSMGLCLVSLWLLAEGFNRWRGRPAALQTNRTVLKLAPFPVWFAVAGMAWLVTSEAATEGWYTYHEQQVVEPVAWSLHWPTDMPQFRENPMGERSRALLKYNEGHLASWRTSEGFHWQMYYLRWLPGRVSKFLAGGHYPTVCLPATGLQLVSELDPFVCQVGTLTIPFVTYLFDDSGRDVYVFHAILEENEASYAERVVYRQAKQEERLASVLRGERNLGQRVIGVAVRGPLGLAEAQDTLQATLHGMIVIDSDSETTTRSARR
ncbi:MAG TPA: exosortase, partial [Opitutus sp.]|nr:exosortase [Opitutus sp.]